MPRGKKTALDASVEQAKAQEMKISAKEMKKQEEMEQSLAETLRKHREEMDRLAAEHENQPDGFEHISAVLDPEEKHGPMKWNDAGDFSGVPQEMRMNYSIRGEAEIIADDPMEQLKDPTEGQDLTHNYDLTIEEFCEKTLSLLSAATQAVRSMELRFGNYETKINQLQEQIRNRAELELAVGFKYLSYGKWYTPRLKACPNCGRHPSLQKEKYDKGWMVICDECWTRSESADGPMAAVKNWNDGKETEVSRMLNEPLTSK